MDSWHLSLCVCVYITHIQATALLTVNTLHPLSLIIRDIGPWLVPKVRQCPPIYFFFTFIQRKPNPSHSQYVMVDVDWKLNLRVAKTWFSYKSQCCTLGGIGAALECTQDIKALPPSSISNHSSMRHFVSYQLDWLTSILLIYLCRSLRVKSDTWTEDFMDRFSSKQIYFLAGRVHGGLFSVL